MSRGKYSSAARARYAAQMELDNRALRKDLAREKREHAVTRRVADESERLAQRCRALEMQLELATTAELQHLHAIVAEQREELRECARRFDFLRRYIRSLGRKSQQRDGTLPMRSMNEARNVASALGISVNDLVCGWAHFTNNDLIPPDDPKAPMRDPNLRRVTPLPERGDWAVSYED